MIKFVYFDLGGVVERDFSGTNKWNELKRDLKINDPNFDSWFDEYEKRLCVGTANFENTKFTLNDFVSRFEVNKSIWPVIDEIRRHCRVGLLTNMYPGMFKSIKDHGILPEINWDIIIDSSLVGLQKPEPKIFELAQKLADVRGEEILFVENTKEHTEVAKTLSWQTFLYDPSHPESSSNNLLAFFHLAPKQRPKYS